MALRARGAQGIINSLLLALCCSFWAPLAEASVRSGTGSGIQLQGGNSQSALQVSWSEGGLLARACAHLPCTETDSSARVAIAPQFQQHLHAAEYQVVPLGQGREAAFVVIADPETEQHWVSVVAAPLSHSISKEPLVVFNDLADPLSNPQATEPNAITVSADSAHPQLVVGTRNDDISLCGRATMLAPRWLDPSDLQLKGVKMQRLGRDERAHAQRLTAVRRGSSVPVPLGHLLTALGASSGIGSPAALTDSDPETTWSEAKSGDGRGEFVVMRVPKEVPLTSIAITVRPPKREVENGVAPRHLWLAADQQLFAITLPEDGWQHPGAVYDVPLPQALSTSCLAVVFEDTYATAKPATGSLSKPASAADGAVTLAEIEARSSFDDQHSDLAKIADSLLTAASDLTKAKAAAAILLRGGRAARQAVTERYSMLDERGRQLALDIIDQGTCEESAPLYVRVLSSSLEGESVHARSRIEHCQRTAAPALADAAIDPAHTSRPLAAEELSVLAPEQALTVLVHRPDSESAKERKSFRRSLARAAGNPKATTTLDALLQDVTLAPLRTLELLRAAGNHLAEPSLRVSAAHALTRVAPAGAPFAQRYLAIVPAANLAAQGDASALALLQNTLADPDKNMRQAAARAAGALPQERARLITLADDPEPRVRESVALAVRDWDEPKGRRALLHLLSDEWTFVRAAAYDSLALSGADPAVDTSLVDRLRDEVSPIAKARLIESVSKRHLLSAGPRLRALAEDTKQSLEVRMRAVQALGGVCDESALEYLTKLAQQGLNPTTDSDAQALGYGALYALGHIHPPDLDKRLAPLRQEGSSPAIRSSVEFALQEPDRCAPVRPLRPPCGSL